MVEKKHTKKFKVFIPPHRKDEAGAYNHMNYDDVAGSPCPAGYIAEGYAEMNQDLKSAHHQIDELSKNHIKKYVGLAIRTEASPDPVLDRIKNNPEMYRLFVTDMQKVIASLQLLDKWKKTLFYGKVVPGLKVKYTWWDRLVRRFKTDPVLVPMDAQMVRILHGSMGIATESGELLEAIDKYLNNKGYDIVNGKEELGDVCWYANLLCDIYGTDLDYVCDLFVRKLKKRYPEKFTEEKAIVRDLDAERKILEQK